MAMRITKSWTMEEEEFVRNNYLNMSDNEVAQYLGRTRKSVQHRRMIMKIKKVEQGSYTVNNQFFSKWSPEMAYILGFIFGDGYIRGNNSTYRLTFHITDYQLLEKIQKAMGNNSLIRKSHTPNANQKQRYDLTINNKNIYRDLNKLGVTTKKSLTMKFPSIPEKYFYHFVRGYFDADGHVNHTSGLYILFVSASKSFLYSLSSELTKRGIANSIYFRKNNWNGIYQLYIKKRKRRQFVENLYQDSTIHLQRKKDVFDKYYTEIMVTTCQDCGLTMNRIISSSNRCVECQHQNKLFLRRKHYHMKKFGHLDNMTY